jgi:drug/metabolite transporter (DMT)-like permease
MKKGRLGLGVVAALLGLALLWGSSNAVIKVGGRELSPLFMAGMRSVLASLCLWVWLKVKGISLFPSPAIVGHGIMVGFLFGLEFGLVYKALEQIMASRAYILTYTAPFFVALGAHFFLKDDRLDLVKVLGLMLAFVGVVVLFLDDFSQFTLAVLPGDFLALAAAASWAATTVYLKRFLVGKVEPLRTLFYQVFFSAPFLLGMSLLWEDPMVADLSWVGVSSLLFQGVVIAFLSYLAWFELVHRHPVSLLHAFSFLTPICGVFLSGWLFMGEPIGSQMILALALVAGGLALINRAPKKKVEAPASKKGF